MAAIVTNASPLIVLARADMLHALSDQFPKVRVPQAVVAEILAGPPGDPMREMINTLPWLEQVAVDPPLSPLAYWRLGRGETEVIEYARLHPGTIALLDDRAARKAAEVLSVPVYGTLAIVARHVARGGTPSFDEGVQRLQAAGLHVAQAVVEAVRKALAHDRKG